MPRIAVIGVGLIGGSIGKAARERGLGEVVGWVRDPARSEACLESGALDEVAPTLEEAVADAEIAFSCVSVGALPEVTGRILAAVGDDTVVTDVGSTQSRRPGAWLGSTITGRWVLSLRAGTASRSSVNR
ncbi:MAG: prephenate dehydrogenase/arogenate dehydrogenase family protein [Solirubrobacterales bacterium]